MADVVEPRAILRRSRSDVLLAEVSRQIAARRLLIDDAQDLGSVTITVKLQAGSTWVRGTVWEEERIASERRDRT